MGEYLYPTHPCDDWVGQVRRGWKSSCRPYFALWFLRVTPNQLIARERSGNPFWLYMYYTQNATQEYCPELIEKSGKVDFRIRVVEFHAGAVNPFVNSTVYTVQPPQDPTIWFKCDRFEEIKKLRRHENDTNCSILSFPDFEHAEGRNLGAALLGTIPPVKLKSAMVVIQTNWFEVQS